MAARSHILEMPLAYKVLLTPEEQSALARRRFQDPEPIKENGMWVIRVREDALTEDGKSTRVRPRYCLGPCIGTDALSKKEARDYARDTVLKYLNRSVQQPGSIIKIEAFILQKFIPEWVDNLKHAGQQHYKYTLKKMLPVLGGIRLRDLKVADVRKLCSTLEHQGCAPKTISHVKTAAVTLINYAKQEGFFSGDNPAAMVRLAQRLPRERYAYSFEEARKVLAELSSPICEMVLMSMTTSLNVAELCGLRRKRLNLTGSTRFSAGEAIPPYSALVRENYYRNRWGTVKTGKRYRTVGLPDVVVEQLVRLEENAEFKDADSPVFASSTGNPIDAHNTNSRLFKQLSKKLDIPITWHIFRHSAATFVEAMDMPLSDREKIMGHANAAQTMHYTHSDVARRRIGQNQLMERILPERDRQVRDLMRSTPEGLKQ